MTLVKNYYKIYFHYICKSVNSFLIVFLVLSSQTRAVGRQMSPCQHISQLKSSYQCPTHKAAVVDENGRRTEEDYASDKQIPLSAVQNRFSPTGILKCTGSELSAQLTGSNDVITTAGHGFFNIKSCQKIANPESCTFTVRIGKYERVSKVISRVVTGFECPEKPDESDDWAVLKIYPPLLDIIPYDIPNKESEIKINEDVIAVSAMARDFVRIDPKTKKKYLPKTIEECQTKRTFGPARVLTVSSNCDLARGASGGSLLKHRDGRDVLMAIHTGGRETEKQLQAAERRGTPNFGRYKDDVWESAHVPLNGRFRESVIRAMNGQSI